MPIHLPPLTRRRFMISLGAALMPSLNAAGGETEEELVAILNDTHIGAKQKLDSPIPTHLAATVGFLVNSEKRPSAVFINGDLALRDGQDY